MGQVVTPGEKVLVHDNFHHHYPYGTSPYVGSTYFTNALGDFDRANENNYDPWYWKPRIGVWHGRKTNFCFLDGSGRLLGPTSPVSYGETDFRANDDRHWKLRR